MNRFALVNKTSNVCENISLDERGAGDISVSGYTVVDITNMQCCIGWLYVDGTFVEPAPTKRCIEEVTYTINKWRAAQENGGILFNGTVFDTDEAAYKRIAAVVLAGANPLGYWTSAANIDVPMTYDDVKALYAAITLAGAEIHARQRAMKLALPDMTDAELQTFAPAWDVAPSWLPPQ